MLTWAYAYLATRKGWDNGLHLIVAMGCDCRDFLLHRLRGDGAQAMTDLIQELRATTPRDSGYAKLANLAADEIERLRAQTPAVAQPTPDKKRLVDLAAQPPSAPVEFDSLSGARKQAMESHASMLPRLSAETDANKRGI